jgi:hypothetical protein
METISYLCHIQTTLVNHAQDEFTDPSGMKFDFKFPNNKAGNH